jgi:hypothetical protein
MGVTYVEAYGEIRQASIAELCSLTPGEASRLLTPMARRGRLIQ